MGYSGGGGGGGAPRKPGADDVNALASDAETKLIIEIKNERPIELIDLTESLLSVGDEYKRFIAANPEFADSPGLKLYVKEIRAGSIVTELMALAPLALPFVHESKNLIEFAKYLKTTYEYFAGKSTEGPTPIEKASYNNFTKIIETTAKDNGSQIVFNAFEGGQVVVNLNMSSTEANAAQNTIRRELEAIREPETRVHNQVVLYWYQARGDIKSNAGDKGIIESISSTPVKVVFDNEKTKALMLLESGENPFRSAYIVDVFVETVSGKPALYKVLTFHDRLEKPQ